MKHTTIKVKAGDYWEYLQDKGYPEDFLISKYTNVWGEEIVLAHNTNGIVVNGNPLRDRIPSAKDFIVNKGFYINDENGDKIFLDANAKKYSRLKKKYKKLSSLKEKVNNEFLGCGFYLQEGPYESVTINDTHIVPDCFWVIPQNEDDENEIKKIIVTSVREYLNHNYEQFYMNVADLEKSIIQSLCNLDISYLSDLDQDAMYSYNFKEELIFEFAKIYKKFLLKGITQLRVKPSKCLHCYPDFNAFSFHHPDTDEFVIRYVIGKDKTGFTNYIVSECNNKPIHNDVFKML